MSNLPSNMARTCSGSFLRIRPMSRNTHVSWRPTARLSSAAQTELSTPPESTQTACPSPTASRILVTAWSM